MDTLTSPQAYLNAVPHLSQNPTIFRHMLSLVVSDCLLTMFDSGYLAVGPRLLRVEGQSHPRFSAFDKPYGE